MFTNPWAVGIGGGFLSGLLVTLITRVIFSRRENREYLQRVATANNEIIYSLRPSISEKNLPSREILDSLLASTARKYDVKKTDLYDAQRLVEDIIKEIMDSGFISSQQKIEFCEQLSILKAQPSPAIEEGPPRGEESKGERLTPYLSALMGIMSAFAVILAIATLYISKEPQGFLKIRENPTILLVGILGILVPVSISIIFVLATRARTIRFSGISVKKEPSLPQEVQKDTSSIKVKMSGKTPLNSR